MRTLPYLTPEWKSRRLRPRSRYPKGRCRLCGLSVEGTRRTAYCSKECANAWTAMWYSGDPHWWRMHVILRDRCTCQECGLVALKPWWVTVWGYEHTHIPGGRGKYIVGEYCVGLRPDWSKLVVHHIKAVAEGGKDVDENVIALCTDCHDRIHFPKAVAARERKARGPIQPALLEAS